MRTGQDSWINICRCHTAQLGSPNTTQPVPARSSVVIRHVPLRVDSITGAYFPRWKSFGRNSFEFIGLDRIGAVNSVPNSFAVIA